MVKLATFLVVSFENVKANGAGLDVSWSGLDFLDRKYLARRGGGFTHRELAAAVRVNWL